MPLEREGTPVGLTVHELGVEKIFERVFCLSG